MITMNQKHITMNLVKRKQTPFWNLETAFDQLFPKSFFDEPFLDKGSFGSIPVNIIENSNEIKLDVIAPGYQKNDFKISIDDNILTISANKEVGNKEENTKWLRSEYVQKSFKRSFTIEEVNIENINATYNNGILTLVLPKKEEVKKLQHTIEIK
jgi:HSP20 family protein